MAVRLHLKIGLVAEQDRLDSSADTVLVTEPTVGSIARSKGSLYVIVTAGPRPGGRAREATQLVAETIRREYYYDESGGIPICLEKALRGANRRLRHQREGHGLQAGSLGIVVAVVRGHELYVAMAGAADAYLVRQARLLTLPDEARGPGVPWPEDLHPLVWHGEFVVGDTLVLVGRDVTRVVGTEELKNAVVTLHPQSAVEHLHHLFVAAGGEGSDALIAIESTEVAATRTERKLVPVRPAEPLAGAPDRSPIPLADHAVSAAEAVRGGAERAREGLGDLVYGIVDRVTSVLPRRGPRHRDVAPLASRRESQRRAAVALLTLLGVVSFLVVTVWAVGALGARDPQASRVNRAERAVATARARLDQLASDPSIAGDRAIALLREAWAALGDAEGAGVSQAVLRPLRAQVTRGLERNYAVHPTVARTVYAFDKVSPRADLVDLVIGPDRAAYAIDRATRSVVRVDTARRTARVVARAGVGRARRMAAPIQLGVGGPDLLVFDAEGSLWRWRPSNRAGRGTLGRIRIAGRGWSREIRDNGTFLRNADAGLYNLYLIDPRARQILRYEPTADGGGLSGPSNYLKTATDVSGFRSLVVDGNVYVLSGQGVTRYLTGSAEDYRLAEPPDSGDLRRGHDYRLMAPTGAPRQGRLWVWDALHRRILAFSKANGAYLEQFVPASGVAPFEDLRGMVVVDRGGGQPPVLLWLTADQLLSTTLRRAPSPAPARTPAPTAAPRSTPTTTP